jgi:hypothetical protein
MQIEPPYSQKCVDSLGLNDGIRCRPPEGVYLLFLFFFLGLLNAQLMQPVALSKSGIIADLCAIPETI